MEAAGFSESSVLTRAARLKIPEDCVLHTHRSEYLKSYKVLKNLLYVLLQIVNKWDYKKQRTYVKKARVIYRVI
jgi:hypothetical protein